MSERAGAAAPGLSRPADEVGVSGRRGKASPLAPRERANQVAMSEPFAAVDVIATKRDGGALSNAQIDWVVDAYTRGAVADEQMSALAMAILLRGMTGAEVARWTAAMIASGERLDLSTVPRPTVDKHSTGGVGDKITLPLTPLVAACGAAVPQLSGRGLGHTGGTLDKLETIPGFRVALTNKQFLSQLRKSTDNRIARQAGRSSHHRNATPPESSGLRTGPQSPVTLVHRRQERAVFRSDSPLRSHAVRIAQADRIVKLFPYDP